MTNVGPFYQIELTCNVCDNNFTTMKIRSRFVRPIKHDSDFCSYYKYEEMNPLFYFVHVCPHCGFSTTEEFSSYFPPNTKEEIKRKVSNKWVNRKTIYGTTRSIKEAVHSYKLGIYSAILKKEKHIVIAGLYLRLAWIYRTKGENGEEKRFTHLALNEYILSYMTDDFYGTKMTEIRLLYLIAELSRRVGEIQQAIQYLSKVIQQQSTSKEKVIIQMAKDCWQEIREMKQHLNTINL
ncbi:DUF2225 domain-containing protein [Bacillus timonensis]|nr:DUF2225 domain-containing protein [Bacillus timonensis]